MDTGKIEQAVAMILEAIGEDPQREGLKYTRGGAHVYRVVLRNGGGSVNTWRCFY